MSGTNPRRPPTAPACGSDALLSLIHVLEWRAVVSAEEIALTDHLGAELTYAAVAAQTNDRAGRYLEAGVQPGDVVAIMARNQAAWVTAMTGLIRVGAVPAAINWRLAMPELTALLRLLRPVAIVADTHCGAAASQAALALANPVPILAIADDHCQRAAPPRPADRLRGDEPAILVHTSGTTGAPKVVPLTHQQLIMAATFMQLEVPEARPGARHLSALPLFHVAGLANLAFVLLTGGHLHVLGAFEPAGFVDELASRRIQLTQLVPTLIQAVTREVSARPEPPDLGSLVEIVYGASPIRPNVLEEAVRVLGCRFRQNYASSETGPLPISSLSPADHDPVRGLLGTAGRPSLGWEVRLGDVGEIQVRGAAALPGYWDDPAATRESLTPDGFYRTGDVGIIDEAGYLTIIDRLRDVIITGGENVYPAEVEAVLVQHPDVADVAVIGIPDERWGETVHAVIVARTAALSAEQLIAFGRERLAGFKCPTGVTTVEALPRNATGKVLRSALREPFWVGHDRRVS
jgi:long-chain acyl-CoA synthetase